MSLLAWWLVARTASPEPTGRDIGNTIMRHSRPGTVDTRHVLARLATALTRPALGWFLGFVILACALARVAGSLDYVQPRTWLWLLLWGAFCACILVTVSLRDPEESQQVLAAQILRRLGVDAIRDQEVASMLRVAADYRLEIARLDVRATPAGGLMADTVNSIAIWLDGIAGLARHVDSFRADADRQAAAIFELRQRIQGLETRITESLNASLTAQLRETIAGRRHQLRMAEGLASLNEQAALRLEQAVASLGTVSYQLAMVARKEAELSGLASVKDDIGTEIERIHQLLAAFDRARRLTAPDDLPSS
jgi:hypothetical protein